MPNWVNNCLKIKNTDRNKIINADGNVDFNILLPMPEALNIESSSINPQCIYVFISDHMRKTPEEVKTLPTAYALVPSYIKKVIDEIESPEVKEKAKTEALNIFVDETYTLVIRDKYDKDVNKSDEVYKTGQILADNYSKYGATTWYEWRNENWGCKWNASDTNIDENENVISITFDTPWSPPDGWIQAMKNAGIVFDLYYEEESGYIGVYTHDGTDFKEVHGQQSYYDPEDENCEQNSPDAIKDLENEGIYVVMDDNDNAIDRLMENNGISFVL